MKFTVLVDPSLVIIIIYFVCLFYSHQYYTLRVRAFASHAGDRGSIPSRDRPKSLKQVVTAPLPNAWQPVWVSRVLGDDHDYKRLARVAVGVARSKTLATQWPWVPSIGQNLQSFTGNRDVSIWVKKISSGTKNSKQTNWNRCTEFREIL